MAIEDDSDHDHLIKLRLHMGIALKKLERLESVLPQVQDNTWWINKIKIGLIVLSVSGIGLGIIKYAFS